MMVTRVTEVNSLGNYLKDRRAKLDPASFGLPLKRRRTPGLRREEVAHRANVSPTWYTWLEQGRGGAPSPEVLERISRALMLTEVEREHLFLLGLGRPPEVRQRSAAKSQAVHHGPGRRLVRDGVQGLGDMSQPCGQVGRIYRHLTQPEQRGAP